MSDDLQTRTPQRNQHTARRAAQTVALAALLLLAAPATPQTAPGVPAVDRATGAAKRLIADAEGAGSAGQLGGYFVPHREFLRWRVTGGSLPGVVRYRLAAAYETAVKKLHEEPGCRALFGQLGADGEAVLARMRYADAGGGGTCQGGVRAFTCVGCPQINLCPSFGTLEVSGATVILLHEALHTAGLLESPAYPNAMTAREINKAVIQGCHLYW